MFSLVIASNIDTPIQTSSKGLSIKGRVEEENTPIPCRLRLFEKLSGRMVFETVTDQSGFYEFDHLTKTKFFIVAHHPASQFNAVIQDNVEPK
ncbi:carboxypeptidase regulatory-like domain-containing protein [Acinetobacter lwoffii]|uniref:carboxypeptidase regulatory-like domain-containing protein n=1 Tax=Acinetobacter lwoffii TaxID=28090 RepID=UPI003F92FBB5